MQWLEWESWLAADLPRYK